jgi:hypothetical protein
MLGTLVMQFPLSELVFETGDLPFAASPHGVGGFLMRDRTMAIDVPSSHAPLMVHFEPPEILTDEGKTIYCTLVAEVRIVAALFSVTDVHLLPVEDLSVWFEELKKARQSADEVRLKLHGVAQKTWEVAHAINRAIFPVFGSLSSVVSFLSEPFPSNLPPEQLAEPSRIRLGELKGIDFRSLLSELAIAMLSESGELIGTESIADNCFVTLDQIAAMVNRSK